MQRYAPRGRCLREGSRRGIPGFVRCRRERLGGAEEGTLVEGRDGEGNGNGNRNGE